MSDLNDSVIICESLPSSNQGKTTSTKEKKKAVKTKKKTFYECSLRHIQLSGKRWEKQRLNSNKGKQHEVENNENDLFFNVETNSLCQDSIIILSDNESEKDKDVCQNKGITEKRYVERLDNNSNRTLKRKRSPILLRSRKRKSIYIADTEDSDKDNENIVTSDFVNQNADDIVVVWSSKNIDLSDRQTKESNIVNEETVNDNLVDLEKDEAGTVNEEKRIEGEAGKETTVNQDKEKNELEGEIRNEENEAEVIDVTQVEDNRLFMIDCSPDPKNLHCLITAKRYKENVKDNDARETQINDDIDLLFNQTNLKLPIAEDISGSITMEKPKSFNKVSAKLKKRLLKLKNKDTQPSTSSVQNATSNDEPSNSVLPGHVTCRPKVLREIVIDGNNVAMSHTNGKSFSEKGLKLVINYFKSRGHSVKVFLPQYRRSATSRLLEKWYSEGTVVFTPSRCIAGRRITPYDDRYILQYATMCKGIVISSDQFRDLYNENPGWRDTIINRLLAPTFVGDIVMFPDDPLGKKGPSLKEFLRH